MPWEETWQRLEAVLLTPSGQKPGTQLHILQCMTKTQRSETLTQRRQGGEMTLDKGYHRP